MEEATYRGVSVNCTVSFSVAQALAAAEAVERGLRRREAEGLPVDDMGPVITLMMGRLEDWLRTLAERDGVVCDPDALPWSGVAVFKRAYTIMRERGLRARLLGAAIRHHYHWSELIGGDCVITLPSVWQKRFNGSSVEVRSRIDDPVDPRDRQRARDALRRLRPGLRAGRPVDRGVRHVRPDGPHAAGVHRLVPRPAPCGQRRRPAEPGRSSVVEPPDVPEPTIHPTALPNTLSCSELLLRPGPDGAAHRDHPEARRLALPLVPSREPRRRRERRRGRGCPRGGRRAHQRRRRTRRVRGRPGDRPARPELAVRCPAVGRLRARGVVGHGHRTAGRLGNRRHESSSPSRKRRAQDRALPPRPRSSSRRTTSRSRSAAPATRPARSTRSSRPSRRRTASRWSRC